MSDRDVERELEANRRRAGQDPTLDEDANLDADGDVIDPLTRVFRGPDDDDEDALEERREESDEEQRPGHERDR